MHDTLQYIEKDPMYRSHHHHDLTFSFLYAFSENFVLPISHDEVVHGKGSLLRKMPGDHWQQLANMRAYLSYMWAHPGKQLLFMGQEFGQLSEWSEERGLDWWILDQPTHKQLAEFVGALNRTYRETAALWQLDDDASGFEWIEGGAANENVIAFIRYDRERRPLLCVGQLRGSPARGLPARPAAARAAGARCSTRMPRSSAARASATSAGSTRPTTRGRDAPRRRCSRCRRSRRCGSRSSAERRGRGPEGSAAVRGRGPLLAAGGARSRQYSRFVSRRRAATTRGSSVPTTSKSSTSRSRTARLPSASSFGKSVSRRSNASSTCPPERSRSATSSCAARSSGAGCRGVPDLVERLALQAPEQVRLREAGHGEGVARVLGDRGAIGGCRGLEVAALDRVVRLLVQRRQRLLDGLRRAVGGRLLAVGLDAARDAVLRAELEELVEDLLDHVVGLHAGEERHRLAGDDGHDRGDRLRLEGLHELRAAVGVGGGEHEAAVTGAHEPIEGRDERAGLLAPRRPQHDDDRDGARELERGGEGRVIRLEDDPIAAQRRACLRRPLLRPLHEGGEVDGTTQVAGGSGVGHGTSDAPIRLSDHPRRRICSSEPTLGT